MYIYTAYYNVNLNEKALFEQIWCFTSSTNIDTMHAKKKKKKASKNKSKKFAKTMLLTIYVDKNVKLSSSNFQAFCIQNL